MAQQTSSSTPIGDGPHLSVAGEISLVIVSAGRSPLRP